MPSRWRHTERHRTDRIGWLRAAVLGANNGIVSTASLVLGVAAASADHNSILLTGVAGLVAGASFAAGAALPLAVTALVPGPGLIGWVAATSLLFLALLGALAARASGARMGLGAWRVGFWGALAMAITAGVGALFGAVV